MSELSRERRNLLQAIKKSERGWTLASLSRALGRNAAYLQQYIQRQSPRRLPEADRHALANMLSVDQTELRPESDFALADVETDIIVTIPYFDVETAAGAASFIDDTNEARGTDWHFVKHVLDQIPHNGISSLRLIKVRGDSMSPTLEDGDVIMIDGAQNTQMSLKKAQHGIYVLDDGHGLVVKRLELLGDDVSAQDRRVRIVSDNANYVPYRRHIADIRIIGRVIWMSRSVI